VDLIDEQRVAELEIRDDRDEIARLLERRPEVVRMFASISFATMFASVVFPSPGGRKKNVIERFLPLPRRRNRDLEVVLTFC
jgi:hypothetical protein